MMEEDNIPSDDEIQRVLDKALYDSIKEFALLLDKVEDYNMEQCQHYLDYIDDVDEIACDVAERFPYVFNELNKLLFAKQKMLYEKVRNKIINRMVTIELEN
jgi:hypothetical protein